MSTQANISNIRVQLLRVVYMFIFLGLGITVWPDIIFSKNTTVTADTVVLAMLASYSLVALLGLRYPLKILPLLIIELLWKSIWVSAFAIPALLTDNYNQYTSDVMFACVLGIVVMLLAIPWGYIYHQYVIRLWCSN
ncbi:hypothetical protein [Teredinibacter purpureus]|uniref:hypothetical protein n=1 Tax=Teredinibacter purpureus TaxID=2731756 RepID=UPI0005F82E32|nr:hypothetical protein [Teredinibacter purpureus]